MNPPAFHLWLLPVIALPAPIAYLCWMVIQVAGVVRATTLASRTATTTWTTDQWLGAIVLFGCAEPWLTTVVTGQLSGLLAWWAAEAWVAARHGKWGAVGFWVGLLAFTKLFFLVLPVGLLVKGRPKAALLSVITGVGYFLVSFAIFGFQPMVDWLDALRHVSWAWVPVNAALSAPIVRLLSENSWYTSLADLPRLVGSFTLVAGAALLVAAFVTVRWRSAVNRDWTLLLVAAIIASPLGHIYYGVVLIAPLLGWLHGPSKSLPVKLLLGLAAVLAMTPLPVIGRIPGVWWTLTLRSAFAWSGIALAAALFLDAWRPTSPADTVLA